MNYRPKNSSTKGIPAAPGYNDKHNSSEPPSQNPDLTPEQLKERKLNQSKVLANLMKTSYPWLNFYERALVERTPSAQMRLKAAALMRKIERSADALLSTPKFTGDEPPRVAEKWIAKFESAHVLHQWKDEMTLRMVRRYLVGSAADWFTTHRMELMRFPRFCYFFKCKYIDAVELAIDWQFSSKWVQMPERGVAFLYADHKMTLCEYSGMNFQCTKQQVILGLQSKKLARIIHAQNHETMEDLMRDIVEFEIETENKSLRADKRYYDVMMRKRKRSDSFKPRILPNIRATH